MQPSPLFKNIFICQKSNPIPISSHFSQHRPPSPSNCESTLCRLLYTSQINRIIHYVAFVTSFFHLACFQGSSMLSHVSVLFPLFLLPNNIPFHGYTTCCMCIHQLIGVWLVSILWLLLITHKRFCACFREGIYFYFS